MSQRANVIASSALVFALLMTTFCRSSIFEPARGFRHVTGLDDARIRDEQRVLKIELARERTEPFDAALPENDAGPRLKIERDHLQ